MRVLSANKMDKCLAFRVRLLIRPSRGSKVWEEASNTSIRGDYYKPCQASVSAQLNRVTPIASIKRTIAFSPPSTVGDSPVPMPNFQDELILMFKQQQAQYQLLMQTNKWFFSKH